MLLYVAKVAMLTGCIALGFGLKSADVHCALEAIHVPVVAPVAADQQAVRRGRDERLTRALIQA
jgi:hypothetical protein